MTINTTTISIVLLARTKRTTDVKCPHECNCYWMHVYIIDCSNRGLTKYPIIKNGSPVQYLNLSNNYFQEFPKQYARVQSLTYLDLSNNDIQELSGDALIGFKSLRNLSLAYNNIRSWSDINPSVAFQHAYSLQKLSLSGNHLERFSANEEAPLLMSDSLTELDLSHCGISEVNNVLSGMPSLQRLVLAGNKLQTLPSLPSKSLRALDISNCSLTWVERSLFNSLPGLQVLDISWNLGVVLGSRVGDVVRSDTLLQLDISFCNLDSLEVGGMPNLVVLLVKGNMLRSISRTQFDNNTALEKIDLSKNVIRKLNPAAFSNLRKLFEIDMSYNKIFRVDPYQFRNNDVLVSINLSRNNFKKFPRFTSNSLRSVNLSCCKITQIDPSIFIGSKALESLDLSNNPITEFPLKMRSGTLKNLDLSRCRFSKIEKISFQNIPKLESLNLSGNRFTIPFHPDFFRSNEFLRRIWLGENPWHCDCDNATFSDTYRYLTVLPQKLQDKSNVRCSTPRAYFNDTWEDACPTDLKPTENHIAKKNVFKEMICFGIIIGWFLFLVLGLRKRMMKT